MKKTFGLVLAALALLGAGAGSARADTFAPNTVVSQLDWNSKNMVEVTVTGLTNDVWWVAVGLDYKETYVRHYRAPGTDTMHFSVDMNGFPDTQVGLVQWAGFNSTPRGSLEFTIGRPAGTPDVVNRCTMLACSLLIRRPSPTVRPLGSAALAVRTRGRLI